MPSLKKNFFYSALLTVANYLFPLITYPYVSRVLGVANIGVCNFVDSVVNYFIMFSMMGITTVGVREIAASRSDRSRQDSVFSSLLSLNAATSLVSAALLVASIFLVPALYAHKELMGIGVVRLLANFLCMEWLFKGVEDFRYITLRTVLIRLLYVVAVFVFVRKPEDYGIYYLLLCLTVVGNALVNVLYSRRFVSFTFRNLSLRGVAGPFFLIGLYTVMASMYTSFNVTYLGFTSTDEQVGYYASATKIFGMIIALFTAFTAIMLPRLSAVVSEGREEEFRRIVLKVLRVLFCLGVPTVLLMEAEAADIIRIISGNGYEGAVTPMRIISPLILVIGMEQVYVLQTMLPKKYDREVLVNSVIGAVVGVGLNVLLVGSMKAVGSAVVWLSAEMTVLAASVIVVSRRAGIGFPAGSLLKEIVRNLPLAAVLAFIPGMSAPFYVRFILAAAVTAIYFILMNLVVAPNRDVKDCVKEVVPRRCWDVLHQVRAHLFLLRILPLTDAFRILWNRACYGFAATPERRRALNERKHGLMEGFLKGTVGTELLSGAKVEEGLLPEGTDSAPIWVCWLQGEEAMPELNRVCVGSIRAHAGKHPVVFLDGRNIPSYVDVPDCIGKAYASGKILPAIYSDYVRCALLARYGGVWLDSTVLLTEPLDEEWFSRPFMSVRQENPDNDSVSRYRWATFCLGSVPGSQFFGAVEALFRRYFTRKDRNADYLLIDYFFDLLCRENVGAAALADRIPVSNPELHTLRGILKEPYDAATMAALTESTSLFKLTYKMDLKETSGGALTYWGFLKRQGR